MALSTLKLGLHGVAESLVIEETLNGTNGADGNVSVPEFSVGKVHDVLLGNGIDLALNLAGSHAAASGDELSANILSNGSGTIQRKKNGGLELGLGTLNLGTADVSAETHPFSDGEVHKVINTLGLVADEVDTPETIFVSFCGWHYMSGIFLPSVAVAGREAHEAVGDIVLVDPAAKLAALVRSLAKGLVVVADNSLGDKGSEVVGGVPADTLNSKSNVGGGHVVVSDANIRAEEVGLLLGELVGVVLGASAGEAGEVLLGEANQLLVGNATGTNKDHAVGSVVALDVVGQLGSGDVADVLAGTKDGAAKALVLESSGVKVVKDNLLNLLLNLLGLSKNDVALALDGGLLEKGVLENIGEDINALGDISVEGLGEVDGVLALWLC